MDSDIGLSVIDRYSYQLYEFLQTAKTDTTLQQLIDNFDPEFLSSTPIIRADLFPRDASSVRLLDFFGAKPETGTPIDKYPVRFRNFESLNAPSLPATRHAVHDDNATYRITLDQEETGDKFSHMSVIFSLFIVVGISLLRRSETKRSK